jgi:UDP:flavonoid glycosyltransferase YjiC (YdhE family)
VRAGAGLRIRYGRRVSANELREATLRVLTEPAFRENAARIGASFRSAGGAEAAARALESEASVTSA